MKKLKFNSEIKIRQANPYILVSKEQATILKKGWKKPMPVLIRINDLPKEAWKINMMPVGDGSFYLYLHGYVRKSSSTKVGDNVDVDIEFDEEYRNGPMHPLPTWFKRELESNITARKNWDELIPSRKKEILRYFSGLKSDEAKKRNLDKAIRVLSGKVGRFMAREW